MATLSKKKGLDIDTNGSILNSSSKFMDNSKSSNNVNLINSDSTLQLSKKSTRIKSSSNNLSNDNKITLVQNTNGSTKQDQPSNLDDDIPRPYNNYMPSADKDTITLVFKLLDIPYFDGKLIQFMMINGTYSEENLEIKYERYNATIYYAEDLTTLSATRCELDASFKFRLSEPKYLSNKDDKRQRLEAKPLENLHEKNGQIEFTLKSRDSNVCDLEVNGVIE